MLIHHLQKLQSILKNPVLIKKKENLLYLTGRSFMQGYLLVKPSSALPSSSRFRRADRASSPKGRRGSISVAFLGDGLEKIDGVHSDFFKNVGKYISKNESLEIFGEFTYAEVNYIRSKNKELKIKINTKRNPVDFQRQIKDFDEVAKVKKSMQIVEKVFGQVRREIKKPGMTEVRLAQFIQKTGLKFGAEDVSFPAIVASGANAAVPHHVPSTKTLKAGESIILDFGFKYQNYCSDFTRTVFLKTVPKRLEIAYNQAEKAYNESILYIDGNLQGHPQKIPIRGRSNGVGVDTPGRLQKGKPVASPTGDQVYQKAVSILAEKHLEKYFIHSLGHGTGLEIHELPNLSPKSKDVLQDGMVFSIEPGVYIPKLGGIRIEDLVYLEKGECKKFINVPTKLISNIV